MQTAMDLYHILSESDTHLRNPVALETQLLADEGMDNEVGKSMLQLLQVCLSLVLPFLSLSFPCLAFPYIAFSCLAAPFLALHRPPLHCLSSVFLILPFFALPFLALPCLALPCLALPCIAVPFLASPCLVLSCLAMHLLPQLCIAFYLLSDHQLCLAPVNLPMRTAVSAITGVHLHAAYAGQQVPCLLALFTTSVCYCCPSIAFAF